MTLATLGDYVTGTADASGNATLTFGPRSPREVWAPTRVQCSSTPAPTGTKPTATAYLGTAGGARLGATEAAGPTGDGFGPGVLLYPGQVITVVFAGVAAGAAVRVDYSGTRTIS